MKKRNLRDDIRNGTSLLEIIDENIDVHAEIYANRFYVGKDRTKSEIIKIVIDDLNIQLKNMILMKFKVKPATRKATEGSSRIGTIHASFEELKNLFGEPHDRTKEGKWQSADGKVRVEWAFLIKGKADMLFTIYDYKSKYPLDQVRQWSLGGKSLKVKDSLSLLLLVE